MSVVVATHNRVARIAGLLSGLLANVGDAEVVVVDDGSSDGTLDELRRLATTHPELRVVAAPNRGEWAARLEGARVATGEVVLMLDDDVLIEPGVLEAHAAHHAGADRLVVVGYMPLPPVPADRHSWARDFYGRAYEGHCRAWEADPASVLQTLWAGHLSLRREHALALAPALDGAPRGYHRDLDLGLCMAEAGLTGHFDRRLAGLHLLERSPEEFVRNAISSGQGLATVHARHRSASASTPVTKLPAGIRGLVLRPRTNALGAWLILRAIETLGRARRYRLQRGAARLLWRGVQARAYHGAAAIHVNMDS